MKERHLPPRSKRADQCSIKHHLLNKKNKLRQLTVTPLYSLMLRNAKKREVPDKKFSIQNFDMSIRKLNFADVHF